MKDEKGQDAAVLHSSFILHPSSLGSETLPGSTLGTPAYMSPEQARGELDKVGPRSDVYSLGATLYCILTGKAPFEGETPAVLEAVQTGAMERPRRLTGWIDAALESICSKAMAREPMDRYDSPRALADDLERWMADEPVSAWREPIARRARRWARRHRAPMAAMAAAVLVGLVGTGAVLAVQTQANRNLMSANRELVAANRMVTIANGELKTANQRTRQRFDLAMDAIKTFHGEVTKDLLLKEKQFQKLRSTLLRGAIDFYGKLEHLLQAQTDPESRAALCEAYEELGGLTSRIADKSAALAIQEKALAVRRELANQPEAAPEIVLSLIRSLIEVGTMKREIGNRQGALELCEQARDLAEGLCATANPSVSGLGKTKLALAYLVIGQLQSESGNPSAAVASWKQAGAIKQALLDANPNDYMVKLDLGTIYGNIGLALADMGRRDEALDSWQRALAIHQGLIGGGSAGAAFREGLAWCHTHIGDLFVDGGRLPEARASLEKARAIQQELVDGYPNVTEFQRDLARTHLSIGSLCTKLGRPSDALASLEKAYAIMKALVAVSPGSDDFQNELAISLSMIADVHLAAGRIADAVAIYKTGLATLEGLPQSLDVVYNLACLHALLARVIPRPGSGLSVADARTEADRAMTLLRSAVALGLGGASLRADRDLDALRARSDFQLLSMDLAVPRDPFAPSR
jgi:serine/threonine-protein kinase